MAKITDVGPPVYTDPERDRASRAFWREIRRASPMPAYEGKSYDGQLLYEEVRRRQRLIQQIGLEHAMDLKTEGARRVAEFLRREKLYQQGFQAAALKSADLLNLVGPPLTKKQMKKLEEEKRLASGVRKHIIPDPDHPRQNVMVDAVRSSHLNIAEGRKRSASDAVEDKMRQAAADRFRADFDLATFHGSKGFALQDKVDGGGGGNASHTVALEARARLVRVRDRLGDRQFKILLCRIGAEASSADMHKNGGMDHVSNNFDYKIALNALVEHYQGVVIVDRTWAAADRILQAAGMGLLR
jgi:hypothetical protein